MIKSQKVTIEKRLVWLFKNQDYQIDKTIAKRKQMSKALIYANYWVETLKRVYWFIREKPENKEWLKEFLSSAPDDKMLNYFKRMCV